MTRRIDVAVEFSPYPAGRFRTDGPYAAERFRDDLLVPALRQGPVRLALDGAMGFGASFLHEAFGGLAAHFTATELRERLSLESSDQALVAEIWSMVDLSPMKTSNPTFPALDHAVLEALSLAPEGALLARIERGLGLGLGDVCQAELDRRIAAREVSAVTDDAGGAMIVTLRRLGPRPISPFDARVFWIDLDSTERLQTIRAYRAFETDPNFRVRVHILFAGFVLCRKPGIPGRWCDGDAWVNVHDKAEATCETCIGRTSEL